MLELPGMCAGSLQRECLRQGQSFAPPGDAAEGERGSQGWGLPPGWLLLFFLLLYNHHIPPQIFFPLAIYE